MPHKTRYILCVALVVSLLSISACKKPDLTGIRVAVLVDEGYLHVYAHSLIDAVERHGGTVTIVAPMAGEIAAMDTPPRSLVATLTADDLDVADFDALLIPGGLSGDRLIASLPVMALIGRFHRARKPIAGICAGARVMAAAGILNGRRATGNSQQAISDGGAVFVNQPVCTDQHLITAQSAGLAELSKLIVEVLERVRR